MKVLAVSDVEVPYLQSSAVREKFQGANLIISCGDLPFDYLEYLADSLNVTVYYVFGNHQTTLVSVEGRRLRLNGGINLDGLCVHDPSGLILAGLEGSLRYNDGVYQYSQTQMWWKVFKLLPALYASNIRTGRYVDVLVTHAPPWRMGDGSDLPHQGFKAFRWLIIHFKPILHLHGHVHLYRQDDNISRKLYSTIIMNAYGFREIEFHPAGRKITELLFLAD